VPPATTIIIDEAGMAATEDLAALVSLARRYQYRIVAIGDPAQLPAVGRGGVFAHWCETVPRYQLATPRRFDQSWEANATLGLRAGDIAAVEAYAARGRLHTVHPVLVAREIAQVYRRQAGRGRTVAITTNTAEAARAINREIQHRRDPAQKRPGVALADGTVARVGDQIASRRNDPSLRTSKNHNVRNRHTWTVDQVAPDGGLVISHPTRGKARLPADYVARDVELGWAVTGYGNQGDTVDVGIAVLEPGTTRNHAYVAMTRGRKANHAWIPDPIGTGDLADGLAEMIARTPRQESALAALARFGGNPRPTREPPAVEPPPAADDPAAKVTRHLDALQRESSPGRSLGL
jgi:ATP-dependent exoDNAse (exonuclease V) alpha subunit